MKRALQVLGVIVLLVAAVVGAIGYSAFGGRTPLVDGAELPGGARVVKDGFVASFVLPAGEKEVALIDAGNDTSGTALLAELSRRGLGPDAVKAIFLTHGHGDHLGGCHLFPNAQVMAFPADVGLAAGTESAKGALTSGLKNPPERTCKVTHPLTDGESVTVGALTVRAFATPGHTGGSASYLANEVLYLGDNANADSDGKLSAAVRLFSDDPDENVRSLVALGQKLKAEGASVKLLAPAHTGQLEGLAPLTALKP